MKRFFAFMLSAMMICSVFVLESSAAPGGNGTLMSVGIVSPGDSPSGPDRPNPPDKPEPPESPEKPDPEQPEGEGPEKPNPEEPGAEKPEKPKPERPEGEKPVSPQTGYPIGIVGLSATAAACGAAAVIAGKKASKR